MICSKKKGPHIETALRITKALVEGTLQHSLTIFMWTTKKNISKIDAAINDCFRTATGALRSSNLEALRVEGNYLSFKHLTERRASNLISKAIANPTHPLFEIVEKAISSTTNRKKNSVSALTNICISIVSLLPQIAFEQKRITMSDNAPPWERNPPQINISLAYYKKANTSHAMYKTMHAELIANIGADRIFYTDGSHKENDWCSYAVVESQRNAPCSTVHQAQLPEYANSYIAELAAIYKAISVAQQSSERSLIFTDNLGILKGLSNATNRSPSLHLLSNCLYYNTNITLAYIPGHCGIEGNDAADLAAKHATRYPLIVEYPNLHQLLHIFKNWSLRKSGETPKPFFGSINLSTYVSNITNP